MSIQFSCPGCGKNIAVADENIGMQVKCPYCESISLVPETTTTNQDVESDKKGDQSSTEAGNPFGAQSEAMHEPINSHLIDAIFFTIFCCLPFGVIGIVYAAMCKKQIEMGNNTLAQEYSKKANTWNMVALVLGIFFWTFFLASFGCGPGG